MATYVLVGTLTEEGHKTVEERPMRIEEVKKSDQRSVTRCKRDLLLVFGDEDCSLRRT